MKMHSKISFQTWKRSKWLCILAIILVMFTSDVNAGRHKKGHGGSNSLMELLTAGIVAKVLQKQDGEGGGGGGGGGGGQGRYYPMPVPMHMGGGGGGGYQSRHSHHHVTEKIIPIPIPQHTTRIIHINAGQGGDTHQQLNQILSGAGGDSGSIGGGGAGGYSDYGSQNQYDGGYGGDQGHESQRLNDKPSKQSPQPSSAAASTTIQHLLFTDTGLFGPPSLPPMPPPRMPMPYMMPSAAHRYYAVRRPMSPYYYDPRLHAAYSMRARPVSAYSTQRWPPSSYGGGMGYYGKAATSPMLYTTYPTRNSWMASSPPVIVSRIPYRRW